MANTSDNLHERVYKTSLRWVVEVAGKEKEDVMIQLVQDFKIDDFINKLIDIITKIKSLHVIRRC